MNFESFPTKLREIIKDKPFTCDDIGLSGSEVLIFEDMVLKIQPISLQTQDEYKMLTWLQNKVPVPRCLYYGEQNNKSYLLMSKMDGVMSCDENYMRSPALLTKLLAEGIKMLWEVDVTDCPVIRNLNRKLAEAEKQVELNLVDLENVEPGTFGEDGFKDPNDLLQWLKENRPDEFPCLIHGDYCLPNIFLNNNTVSGYIDIGGSGVGDKWQDIALCFRSLKHNFEGKYNGVSYDGYESDLLFEELGIKPDWDKINYYILMDELF